MNQISRFQQAYSERKQFVVGHEENGETKFLAMHRHGYYIWVGLYSYNTIKFNCYGEAHDAVVQVKKGSIYIRKVDVVETVELFT